MATAVAEARRERELSKQALAEQFGAAEAMVRSELDWKAKLRKNGPRLAVIGGAIVITTVLVMVARKTLAGKHEEEDDVEITTLEDISRELKEIREQLKKHDRGGGSAIRSAAFKAAGAVMATAGTAVARNAMQRFSGDDEESSGR